MISKKELRIFWSLIILPDLETTCSILCIALSSDRGVLYHIHHALCYDPKQVPLLTASQPCEKTPAFHLNYIQTPLSLDLGLLTSHGSISLVLGPQTRVNPDISEVRV